MSRIREEIDRTAQDLLRVWAALPETERIMRESTPYTHQHAPDSERRGPELWCDVHERNAEQCWREDRYCRGVPLSGPTDHTGNDAVATRVWEDGREARKRAARLLGDAAWFVNLVNRYRDADPTPQRERILEDTNTPWCERHLRYGHERVARSAKGSRVKREDGTYVFTEPKRLCEWCTDLARDFGRLATEQEIRHHVDGKRLMRPA